MSKLSATLTSLAMLKVNIDQRRDYLDYLKPFVIDILARDSQDSVTPRRIQTLIRSQFGLQIPERAVQIVIKRLARSNFLEKKHGVYQITRDLPQSCLTTKRARAERHINSVVNGLTEFSRTTPKPYLDTEQGVKAICSFLAQFEILCLRAYLRGTAIPAIKEEHDSDIALVGQYVLHLQKTEPDKFESFLVMLQGHMLANALLCPDLQNAPKSYKGVVFYFDTPLLVRLLRLEDGAKYAATNDLIKLLQQLAGKVAIFSHTYDELRNLILVSADKIDAVAGRGSIVTQARRSGTTRSDLLLLSEKLEDRLRGFGIEVRATPRYSLEFQIDETAFERVLDDEVSYLNPRAREYDINSLRSVYALRRGSSPSTVEKSRAVLVTSNSGFARAAWEFGQEHEESKEVSSVITDFSLANMAWLKAPMGAPSLPMHEVLAFSYAALQPSTELLGRYLEEIDKLERDGTISARDHQLLRSSPIAQRELMCLTLGDETALTEETVTETLRRVTKEIQKEEADRVSAEQAAHRQTQEQLASKRREIQNFKKRMFWHCHKKANRLAALTSAGFVLLLVTGVGTGVGLQATNRILGWIFMLGSVTLGLFTLVNLMVGATMRSLHQLLVSSYLTWCLRRKAEATGIDLGSDEP